MKGNSMEQKTKILIAEDSPTQAAQLQYILESAGHEVIHALNGKEACSLLKVYKPDIVISDILMPEMNGYELCEKIKENEKTKHIPVIMLTQLSDPRDIINGLKSGANNFISKPYCEDTLLKSVVEILENVKIRKNHPDIGGKIEIHFGGENYTLNSKRLQILDLLLSIYNNSITKNKELENKNEQLINLHDELLTKNEELLKLDEEKNELLGIAAHDLRSPLSTMSGYFSLLSDSLEENTIPHQDKIIPAISSMLDFSLNLITDVLDYTKVESGNLHLKKENLDIVSFMNQTIELANVLGGQKNTKIHPLYSEDKIIVNVDTGKLKQVMDNLISNALKYSERNTNVHIDLVELEDDIQVVVSDQGKGIPANEVDGIFKPFVTTSVKSTAGEKSTGLGLVSVKKIIETHGGRIWLESVEGEGSQFYFTIPTKNIDH